MENLDIFGSIVGLNYMGQSRFRTKFGGFMSLNFLMLSLAIVIIFFKKFLDRDTPEMTIENQKVGQPNLIDTSKLKFAVMTKFFDRNEFHPEIFKIEAIHTKQTYSTGEKIVKKLDQIPCELETFKEAEDQYIKLGLDKALCFNTNGTKIRGSPVNDVLEFITIKFLLCVGEDKCKALDEIEKFLKNSSPMAITYIYDTVFQPREKTQFVKRFINYFDVALTFYNIKSSSLYFAEDEMEIEEGYFLSSSKTLFHNIVFESFRDSVSVRANNQIESLFINFYSSKKTQIIHIRYMQLSTLLANVGAILGNLMIILQTKINYINNLLYNKDLMESLINLKPRKETYGDNLIVSPSTLRKVEKINVFSQYGKRKKTFDYNYNNNNNNNNKDHIANYINNKNNQNNIDYNDCNNNNENIDYNNNNNSVRLPIVAKKVNNLRFKNLDLILFKLSFCNCSRKKTNLKYYSFFETKMLPKIEFKNIFKKIQEYDLLKYSLLDSETIDLLQSVKKPSLYFTQQNLNKNAANEQPKSLFNFSDYYISSENQFLKNELLKKNKKHKRRSYIINPNLKLILNSTPIDRHNILKQKMLDILS